MLFPFVALKSRFLPSALYRFFLINLAFLLFVVFVPFASAQEQNEDEVIRVTTDLSVFPIRVKDKKGGAVPGLQLNDFQLKDTDKITTSLYLATGADRVSLIFALDQSGSLRDIIEQQRDAALGLFERFGSRSRVGVIRFTNRPTTVVPLSDDVEAARGAFKFAAGINSRTAIFDAASAAVGLFDLESRDPTERRIVILLSDGLDNSSAISPGKVIAEAQTKNISFYVIHIPLFEPRDGKLVIRKPTNGFLELAERTGGKYFLVGNSKQALNPSQPLNLEPIFKAIEEDLRSQYVLGFYASESARDGKPHRVSITISRPGLSYSVSQYGYDRTHNFSVNLTPRRP